jgi:hypothetical protein
MDELLNEYRERMGWNDESLVIILYDYIQHHTNQSDVELTLRNYLKNRAEEEEQIG